MANPFLYPQAKHRRRFTPPLYSNYRRYKPVLQEEFRGQCVYCRALDRVKGQEGFGVDHYRPVKHFPLLAVEYLNLFYSCNRCNALKRDFWPSLHQRKRGQFVPNPCEHIMFDHLRYQKGRVKTVSQAGEWTAELLDLNDPQAVEFREALITALDAIGRQLVVSRKTVAVATRRLSTAKTASEKTKLADALRRAQEDVADLERAEKNILG